MDNIQPIDNDEIEIDLKDLFLELLSFWKLILLAVVLGAGIAYAASRFLMVPQYESVCAVEEYVDHESCGHSGRNKSDERLYGCCQGASGA